MDSTRRGLLSGLLALVAAPFVRWKRAPMPPPGERILPGIAYDAPGSPGSNLAPFWYDLASDFDMIVGADGDRCFFCRAPLARGEIVRMVPEPPGQNVTSVTQCARCAAADLLPLARQPVDHGGLRLPNFATLAQIPTDCTTVTWAVDVSSDPILAHARFTMLVSGGTCVCGTDLAPGALVALLPDPRAEQIDGLGADGPALVVYEASCAAREILPRWDPLFAVERERWRKVFEEEARVLAARATS